MCGRYTLTLPLGQLLDTFQVPPPEFEFQPRFNIAPSQKAPVVARDSRGRRMGLLRWGLVPSWAKDPSIGNRLINARSETVDEKPSFRSAFRRRRCLVPADGFFEWKKEDGEKMPCWVHPANRGLLAFAGLWERWEPEGSDPLHTFTILTREAAPEIRGIHPRMPVILAAEAWNAWLDPETDPGILSRILEENQAPALSAYPVSSRVNVPRNDDPSCIEPLAPTGDQDRDEDPTGC